jgi:hypothetical protein
MPSRFLDRLLVVLILIAAGATFPAVGFTVLPVPPEPPPVSGPD